MNEQSKLHNQAVQERADLVAEGKRLYQAAEAAGRDLTPDEKVRDDAINARLEVLGSDIARHEQRRTREMLVAGQAPAFNSKTKRGDTEESSLAHYFRTGDTGAVASLMSVDEDERGAARSSVTITLPQHQGYRAAAVDSTMNITTDADGKYAVPTGFAGNIVNRKNESDLTVKLGLRMVPGKGTTVNYPLDGADPEVFAATSEQADNHTSNPYERNAGVMGIKAFTLAKKSRKIDLTEETLEDNDIGILAHIADRIGREVAKTHNAMLITEVAANGTALKTYASATAIAAGDPEAIMFNDALGYYLEDGGSIAWVTRPSTFGAISALTGNPRLYAQTPGGAFQKQLLNYPVEYSQAVAAPAASAKDLYFGNWNYVGWREAPDLRFIMDPYSVDGLTILKYSFRAVAGVLQAAAVGYGVHPTG